MENIGSASKREKTVNMKENYLIRCCFQVSRKFLLILFVYCSTSLAKSLSIGFIPFNALSMPLKMLETNTFHPCLIIDRITTAKISHVSNPYCDSAQTNIS